MAGESNESYLEAMFQLQVVYKFLSGDHILGRDDISTLKGVNRIFQNMTAESLLKLCKASGTLIDIQNICFRVFTDDNSYEHGGDSK